MAGLNGKYAEIGKIHQGSDTKVCILNVNRSDTKVCILNVNNKKTL